jgi:hypothetical protein
MKMITGGEGKVGEKVQELTTGGCAVGPGGGVRAAKGRWQHKSSPVRWRQAVEQSSRENREGGERGRR